MLLSNLNLHKPAGIDGIHPHVLNKCSSSLNVPITYIFIKSICEGRVPAAWLEANITPLHKKGSKLDASNYRPISLTSACCKILERIVKDCLTEYLSANNLLSQNQHGFVPKKSCITNLLETIDQISHSMAKGYSVDVLYLDYEKAFDTPPHDLMLHKLSGYGISNMLLNWINSFLSKRTQRVVMGSTISDSLPVTSGVPQGSVLGPLLFILYINDITDLVSNPMKLYADDSKVISTNSTPESPALLQMDINHIVSWTLTWRLRLNYKKCLILHFNKSKNPNHQYYILTQQGKQLLDS